jgi:hypothetical protein
VLNGLELKPIARLFSRRYAAQCVAASAGVLGILRPVFYGPLSAHAGVLSDLVLRRLLLFSPVAAIFAFGGWWTVRSWRVLWRRGRSRREKIVYDTGVRGVGFTTAVGLCVLLTYSANELDGAESFGLLTCLAATTGLFLGFPISLHFGYFWGQALCNLTNVEEDPQLERGQPPSVC